MILGIDIAKGNFHVALLEAGGEHGRSFPNNAKGFAQLHRWLKNRKVARAHACMESTGAYGEALAIELHEHGHVVSIVNPARIKGFAQSEMARNKTDALDAGVIARFCKALVPAPWTPPSPEIRTLQSLTRRLTSLIDARQQERNRASVPGVVDLVAESIAAHIDHLDAQIRDLERQIHEHIDHHPRLRDRRELLESIPGFGDKTAARLAGELPDVSQFASAKQLSAYVGLSPRHVQSGTSIRWKTRLSKRGNAQLRKALYFPAIAAIRFNPILERFARRLRAAGKSEMLIIGAVMRKLIHIAYGVLRSQKPFDPNYDTVRA
ncbi:MAG TPA: transposase [Candidatus Eremiobacteraceae bacterium]|nr:transposase [Candidatus Eremiobacteraceae bacterium]